MCEVNVSKKDDSKRKVINILKKPLSVGDTVKVVSKCLMQGKVGVIQSRKFRCDDGKVKAWVVKFDNCTDIFWEDDLKII